VFRRRRSADVGQDRDEEPDGPDLYDDEFDESATEEQPAGVPRAEGGPWDAGEPYPARERVDLGSVRVPVGPDYEIQLVMADQHGAWVTVRHGQRAAGPGGEGFRLVRFVGIDGPRWFLRGLFTGPAAVGGEAASTLEDVLRDVVVVRGEHPVPPRDILELRLPPEARQALEEQAAAAEENRFRTDLNPFERGPEFTETR